MPPGCLTNREDRVERAIFDVARAQDEALRINQRADEGDHPASTFEARGAIAHAPQMPDRRMLVEAIGDRLLAGKGHCRARSTGANDIGR